MDEPTSNVDYRTDALVQRVVLRSFRASTVITIAHRLQTVSGVVCRPSTDERQCTRAQELGVDSI